MATVAVGVAGVTMATAAVGVAGNDGKLSALSTPTGLSRRAWPEVQCDSENAHEH